MQQKLKIGLLSGTSEIPAWQHAMLTEISDSDFSCIAVRIQLPAEPQKKRREGLAHSLYTFVQQRRGEKPFAHDACASMDVGELLRDVDFITLPIKSSGDSSLAQTRTLEEIQAYRLDVILALGDISSINSLLGASRYGVWFYDYSYSRSRPVDSSWVGLREVLGRQPYLRSALMVRSSICPDDRAAYESFSSVIPISHEITRNQNLWKIRTFVPRVLRKLHSHGGDQFLNRLRNEAPVSKSEAARVMVDWNSPSTLVSLAGYACWRLALKIDRKFFNEKWILMYQLKGDRRDLASYSHLHPPREWFWADPFVIQKEDRYFIFFEEASVATGHGHIALICMDDSGNCGQPKRILERPYHLSYPFVFEWKAETYMIAESAENRTVEAYRCKRFPDLWEFECTLMDNVSAYDATLFEHDSHWWLFANVREHDGASSWDELCVFYADNPLSGNWLPHPENPIISDVRSARPAGRIFRERTHIYRPSQNSSVRYGYGLNFNEILELSKTTYRERLVESIEPGWDRSIRALHTFNETGDLAVIDAIHRTRKQSKTPSK